MRQVFEADRTPADIAVEVARHMVRANLSGHDSHGVIRVKQYVAEIEAGDMVPDARPAVLRETDATGLIDARRGCGLYTTAWTLDWAMERASRHGVAVAAIRHSTHTGRMGEYAERAAERGLMALMTVGAAGPRRGTYASDRWPTDLLGRQPFRDRGPRRGQTADVVRRFDVDHRWGARSASRATKATNCHPTAF